ncbi:CPBP family intramembrane glutamic endopeptidase [Neobacillus niacini]|uniref:CPBP family intramembrane glutamic endopeptidase n=1 Tax=Neobacillus niacini TaxID=86668 RepID=UPI003983C98C
MKQKNVLGFLLSTLFIVLIYFFTRSYYGQFLWFILGLLLLLAFLKEENRLFAWTIMAFFGGNFILFYTDKFIQGFNLMPFARLMAGQLLCVIPILSMCYVIKTFNKNVSFFLKKPELEHGRRIFYIILAILSVAIIILLLTTARGIDMNIFFALISFTLIHAIGQEVMWRGILLTQFIGITNDIYAILFSSIAFAINTTIFGFSPAVVLFYLFLGILFAILTIKCKSILPSIIAHTMVLIFFYLIDWLQLPL